MILSAASQRAVLFLLPIVPLAIHVSAFGLTWSLAPLAALGFGVWTLAEYWLHRAAHVLPWLQMDHWLHHDNPRDPAGPALYVEVAVAMGSTWGLWGLVGGCAATALMTGFLLGYAAFAAVHYAVHNITIGPEQPRLYKLKLDHVRHHKLDDVNFGVLTDFWDRVFGTTAPE